MYAEVPYSSKKLKKEAKKTSQKTIPMSAISTFDDGGQ
jgi:hypothetical protein